MRINDCKRLAAIAAVCIALQLGAYTVAAQTATQPSAQTQAEQAAQQKKKAVAKPPPAGATPLAPKTAAAPKASTQRQKVLAPAQTTDRSAPSTAILRSPQILPSPAPAKVPPGVMVSPAQSQKPAGQAAAPAAPPNPLQRALNSLLGPKRTTAQPPAASATPVTHFQSKAAPSKTASPLLQSAKPALGAAAPTSASKPSSNQGIVGFEPAPKTLSAEPWSTTTANSTPATKKRAAKMGTPKIATPQQNSSLNSSHKTSAPGKSKTPSASQSPPKGPVTSAVSAQESGAHLSGATLAATVSPPMSGSFGGQAATGQLASAPWSTTTANSTPATGAQSRQANSEGSTSSIAASTQKRKFATTSASKSKGDPNSSVIPTNGNLSSAPGADNRRAPKALPTATRQGTTIGANGSKLGANSLALAPWSTPTIMLGSEPTAPTQHLLPGNGNVRQQLSTQTKAAAVSRAGASTKARNVDISTKSETGLSQSDFHPPEVLPHSRGGTAKGPDGKSDDDANSSKSGAGTSANSTAHLPPNSIVPDVFSPPKIWSLPNAARGDAIQKLLGQNLPNTYPKIDRFDFDTGKATSIKSLDVGAKQYLDPAKLASKLRKYVDDVAEFAKNESVRFTGVRTVTPEDISSRILQLAIPPGKLTPGQRSTLEGVKSYARSAGVDFEVLEVEEAAITLLAL